MIGEGGVVANEVNTIKIRVLAETLEEIADPVVDAIYIDAELEKVPAMIPADRIRALIAVFVGQGRALKKIRRAKSKRRASGNVNLRRKAG